MSGLAHTMTVADSRRLTGPSLLLDRPGAVLEVQLDEAVATAAVAAWGDAARRLLDAVGWSGERSPSRRFAGGASLALTAPLDALYAATELNEAAWASAWPPSSTGTRAEDERAVVVARLREAIAARAQPGRSLALREAARARGVTFLVGEDAGLGRHRRRARGLAGRPRCPTPAAVDWARVHDVPVALVTGSNGKTTVVRLLAAMASSGRAAPRASPPPTA